MRSNYNPNDQRFYDQLAQLSGIERRGVEDQRYRDEKRLQSERQLLQAIMSLPDVYHKRFAEKRERTPLKYGEETEDQTTEAETEDPTTEAALTEDTTPKTVHNFDDQDIGSISPQPVSPQPPVDNFVMQDKGNRMGESRNYSPGYSAVLDGLANPGYNPPKPIRNPWMGEIPLAAEGSAPQDSRWAEQEQWLMSPEGQAARGSMPGTDFLPYISEEQIAEMEKKKRAPVTQEIGVRASARAPRAELKKQSQDPRVSFRRFGADEFLRNNAVFQMDLKRIQPTYATMVGRENALAKSGKDGKSQKEWEILKDFDTEEGAAAYNAYTGEVRPVPGLKRYVKPEKPGSVRPVEIADENNQPIWVSPEDAIGKRRPNPTIMVPGYDAHGNQITVPVPRYPKPGQKPIPKEPPDLKRPQPPKLPEGLDMGILDEGESPNVTPEETPGDEGAFVPPERSLLDKFLLSGTAYAEEQPPLAELRRGREESPIVPVAASPDAPAKQRGLDTSKIKFGTPYLKREPLKDGPPGKPTELPPIRTVDREGNPIEVKRRVYQNGAEEVEFYPVHQKASDRDKKEKKAEKETMQEIDAQLKLLDQLTDQFNDYKRKNPTSFGVVTTPVIGDFISPVMQIFDQDLEALDQTMSEMTLDKLVKTMTGLSRNFDTAKEAKNLEAIKFKVARGEKTTRQMIERVRENLESVQRKLEAAGVKSGYQASKKVRVRNAEGETWDVPEDLLDAAKKDGFNPVE